MTAAQSFPDTPPLETQTARTKKPRVIVIREEFIALTGDPLIAAVLNQLVYWSGRVSNLDLYLEEEKTSPPKCSSQLQYGWFYKSSSELIEETMLCVTSATLRRYLDFLEERGWIETRTNPQQKWDRTSQYRVNLRKLSIDLQHQGYALPGFLKHELLPNVQNASFEKKEMGKCEFSREDKNETSNVQNPSFEDNKISSSNEKKQKFESSKSEDSNGEKIASRMEKNYRCNTEITTKTTNKEHTQRTRAREGFADLEKMLVDESVASEMVRLWEQHVGQKILCLTDERESQLESLFAFHFKNDIRLWEQFCRRVKSTPFLMGNGPRRWKVKLDWILDEGNFLKILEGNYDDSEGEEQSSHSWNHLVIPQPERAAEKAAIIASIKDPIWKDWCSQLAEGVRFNEMRVLHEPLSAFELAQIANARFLECEDDRFIWIGSKDQAVLNKIEDLRLKITWVFAKDYPNARSLRTCLDPLQPPLQPSKQSTTPKTGENHV